MTDWMKQRNLILSAWPTRLGGRDASEMDEEKDNLTISSALLEMAGACVEERDWEEWKDTVLEHWPVEQPSIFKQLGAILGPTLSEGLGIILLSHQRKGEDGSKEKNEDEKLRAVCKHMGYPDWPARPAVIHDPAVQEQARLLCEQYHLAGIDIWSGLLGQAKHRLEELRMALSNFALAVGQESSRVGRGRLIILLGGKIQVATSSMNYIELPQDEQGLARGWCQWRLSDPQSRQHLARAEREWRQFLWTGERGCMARKRIFMLMTQQSLRNLAGGLVDRSSAGELALRRYRAAGRWMDEATNTQKDNAALMRGWRKVKTGNRIAWTGLTSGELGEDPEIRSAIDNWQWEDRILEAAFWRSPQWNVPVWFQRFLALGSDTWPENMHMVREEKLYQAWAFAFEGIIRNKMGYDSNTAKGRPSHPIGPEARLIEKFFNEHLGWVMRE